jgi:hypothetical protein
MTNLSRDAPFIFSLFPFELNKLPIINHFCKYNDRSPLSLVEATLAEEYGTTMCMCQPGAALCSTQLRVCK